MSCSSLSAVLSTAQASPPPLVEVKKPAEGEPGHEEVEPEEGSHVEEAELPHDVSLSQFDGSGDDEEDDDEDEVDDEDEDEDLDLACSEEEAEEDEDDFDEDEGDEED